VKQRLEPSIISPEARYGGLSKGGLSVLHRQVSGLLLTTPLTQTEGGVSCCSRVQGSNTMLSSHKQYTQYCIHGHQADVTLSNKNLVLLSKHLI
jgi:hypothetical protein